MQINAVKKLKRLGGRFERDFPQVLFGMLYIIFRRCGFEQMPLKGNKCEFGWRFAASFRNGSVWNQTQHFTLIIQSFSVLVGECIYPRKSVLRNNCSDLHVTLDLALFIMWALHSQAFMSYKFPKPHKLQVCSLDVLEVSLTFPQLSTEF